MAQLSNWLGIAASQTYEQVAAYVQAIHEFDIQLFVELGAFKGGLAALMMARCEYLPAFRYLGLELTPAHLVPAAAAKALTLANAELLIADVFDVDIQRQISGAILGTRGRAFVLCDDGNKPREMDIYAPLLRPGDYIAAHDYPKEIGDGDLQILDDSPYFEAVDPDRWRTRLGVPLYRRLA